MSKNSLSMAYAMKKRSKNKYAKGGEIESQELQMDKREPESDFAKSINRNPAADRFEIQNQDSDMYAEGGEVEEHYASIADAILAKKKRNAASMEEPEQDAGAGAFFDESNEDAAMKENFQDAEESFHDLNTDDVVDSIIKKRIRKS